jgi:hypothetical protein
MAPLSRNREETTMRGFLYRLAVAMKDRGERWNMPGLIRAALAFKERL